MGEHNGGGHHNMNIATVLTLFFAGNASSGGA
jgi:hypothetical protein